MVEVFWGWEGRRGREKGGIHNVQQDLCWKDELTALFDLLSGSDIIDASAAYAMASAVALAPRSAMSAGQSIV